MRNRVLQSGFGNHDQDIDLLAVGGIQREPSGIGVRMADMDIRRTQIRRHRADLLAAIRGIPEQLDRLAAPERQMLHVASDDVRGRIGQQSQIRSVDRTGQADAHRVVPGGPLSCASAT